MIDVVYSRSKEQVTQLLEMTRYVNIFALLGRALVRLLVYSEITVAYLYDELESF